MTITTVGWAGTVNEAQFAELMALAPGDSVRALSEWQVSQGVGRQVSVSAGKAFAKGLLSTSTAAELVTLPTPTNGQWFAIVRRLNWVGKTTAVVEVPHSTTTTAIPTAPPATFPALNTTPGVSYDHVLAWAWVRASDTTMVLFDLRRLPASETGARGDRAQYYASDLNAMAAIADRGILSGDLCLVEEMSCLFRRTASGWVQETTARFASTVARNNAYAKAGGTYLVTGAECFIATGEDQQLYYGGSWQSINQVPKLTRGNFDGSTSGSGGVAITHGLGVTPVAVMITGRSGGAIPDRRTYVTTTRNATTFTVVVYRQDSGGTLNSNPVDFDWIAVS